MGKLPLSMNSIYGAGSFLRSKISTSDCSAALTVASLWFENCIMVEFYVKSLENGVMQGKWTVMRAGAGNE